MFESDSRRIRLLFRTGDVDRQFCWFEQRGDDLYWGPPQGRTIKGADATLDERGLTLHVSDEIEIVDSQPFKAPFHASGQFHVKRGTEILDAPQQWQPKNEIKAPYRIAALLSKHPVLYEPYRSSRSLIRGRTEAFVLRANQEQETTRYFFEFFVTPEGHFPTPPPLLKGAVDSTQPYTFSLNEQLILVVRHFVFSKDSPLASWHPELEVWLHLVDESNAPTDT
jgi:hypothetical protein